MKYFMLEIFDKKINKNQIIINELESEDYESALEEAEEIEHNLSKDFIILNEKELLELYKNLRSIIAVNGLNKEDIIFFKKSDKKNLNLKSI